MEYKSKETVFLKSYILKPWAGGEREFPARFGFCGYSACSLPRGICNPTHWSIRICNPPKDPYLNVSSRICFRKALSGLRIRKSVFPIAPDCKIRRSASAGVWLLGIMSKDESFKSLKLCVPGFETVCSGL